VLHFIEETYRHYKTIASTGEGRDLVNKALGSLASQPGVLNAGSAGALATAFLAGIAQDRHWDRQGIAQISA